MRKSSLALIIGLIFLLLTIIIGLMIVSQAGQYGSYALAGGSLILMSGVLMGSLMGDRGAEREVKVPECTLIRPQKRC